MQVSGSNSDELYAKLIKGICPKCHSHGKLSEVDMNGQSIKTCNSCSAGFIVYAITQTATTF